MTDPECEGFKIASVETAGNGEMDTIKRPWSRDYGREAAEAAQVCLMGEAGSAPLAPWGIPYGKSDEPDFGASLEYCSLSSDFEMRLAGALAVLTENKMFDGGASPLALAFPEARNWRFTKAEGLDFSQVVAHVSKLRRLRSKKDWRETTPNSIDNYRKARTENGSQALERRKYRAANPDKIKIEKSKAAFRRYEKPFVAIDFEGQNYIGEDVEYLNRPHVKHRVFLGMAGGWKRTNDPVALAAIEREGKTNSEAKARHAALMREGKPLDFTSLGDADKRPLASVEIIEWLLGLPKKYGKAIFVMFVFNYDVTQILADLPRAKVFEICKRKKFNGSPRGGDKINSAVLYKGYAIKYLKSKIFQLWRLRDANKPFKDIVDRNGNPVIDDKTGKPKREIDATDHITIYDTFGFYQSAFVKVSKSLVENNYFKQTDHDIIVEQKANREAFNNTPFETIKHYCSLELEALSKATSVLRDGFNLMPTLLRLHAWSGAGSAASALFRQMNLKKDHFPDGENAVRTIDIRPFQDAAHHAYFGGNIQLMKQGYAPDRAMFGYDITSAYPSACLELPSMKGGHWTHDKRRMYLHDDFAFFRQTVVEANILSMFLVRWRLPFEPEPTYDRKTKQYEQPRMFPFFPLPYRTKNGGILFPADGLSWIMRDELIGALDWIGTFFPTVKARKTIPSFDIIEQWRFTPGNDAKPFEIISMFYDLRAATPKTDTLNQALKLLLNSLYGKLAQSVGGGEGKPPSSACPYYAAAITANCRMRLMQAALRSPYDIVMFATDGIVSTKELFGLDRVRDVDPPELGGKGEKPELGHWEMNRLGGGFFLQSGVYVLFDPKGAAKSKKSRGLNPHDMMMKSGLDEFLIGQVLPQWRKRMTANDKSTHPRVEIKIRKYITAGSAVVSPERFRVIGRWVDDSRWLDVHNLGVKRELFDGKYGAWLYLSRNIITDRDVLDDYQMADYADLLGATIEDVRSCYEAGEAFRVRFLVPTLPARNRTPDILSAPRMPDWIDDELDDETDQFEIAIAEACDDE